MFHADNNPVSLLKNSLIKNQTVNFIEPPSNHELTHIKHIYIHSMTQSNDSLFAGIQSALRGTPITANSVDIFEEQQRALNSKEAIMVIKVLPIRYSHYISSEPRFSCDSHLENMNLCREGQMETFEVSCANIIISAQAHYHIKNGKNKRLTDSQVVEWKDNVSLCQDELERVENFVPNNQLIKRANLNLGKKLGNVFLPNITKRKNELFVTNLLADRDEQRKLKQWKNMASRGELKNVLEYYLAVNQLKPGQGEMLFNIGFIYQALGEFKLAQTYFIKAERAGIANKELLSKHQNQVTHWIQRGIHSLPSSEWRNLNHNIH